MTTTGDFEVGDNLANRLLGLFGELLESERQIIAGADDARRNELRRLIEQYNASLHDEAKKVGLFDEHIAALSESERPQNRAQELQAFADWQSSIEPNLDGWRLEMSELTSRPVDHEAIFSSARNKAVYLLRRAADALAAPADAPITGQMDIAAENQRPGETGGAAMRLYIKPRNNAVDARCDYYSSKRVVVLANSTAVLNETQRNTRYNAKLRRSLIDDAVLVKHGDKYRFSQDYEFNSPSGAASAVLGSSANGYLSWKDANGVPLDDLLPDR